MPSRRSVATVVSPASTTEEAAAIAAAIERFASDTAPPLPADAPPRHTPWQRAALLEGTGREPDAPSPWGDPVPWG